jgi:hypothetical protein
MRRIGLPRHEPPPRQRFTELGHGRRATPVKPRRDGSAALCWPKAPSCAASRPANCGSAPGCRTRFALTRCMLARGPGRDRVDLGLPRRPRHAPAAHDRRPPPDRAPLALTVDLRPSTTRKPARRQGLSAAQSGRTPGGLSVHGACRSAEDPDHENRQRRGVAEPDLVETRRRSGQ